MRLVDILPLGIRQKIASNFIEHFSSESGIRVVLYDPRTDILRFEDISEAHEAVRLLRRGFITDAQSWMPKISPYIPKGGTVFDVGGFRGVTAQWFSRTAGKVFVFEPMPENVESIRAVLRVRGIGNVSVHQVALSEQAGTHEFHIYKIRGHNSLGRVKTYSEYERTIQVPTARLDEFAAAHAVNRIDFLKIDVEGFELEVLKGAEHLLSEKRIEAMLFELNQPILRSIGKSAKSIYEYLASHSYLVTDLDGNTIDLEGMESCKYGDFLARPQ